jgi:hypothetical protein
VGNGDWPAYSHEGGGTSASPGPRASVSECGGRGVRAHTAFASNPPQPCQSEKPRGYSDGPKAGHWLFYHPLQSPPDPATQAASPTPGALIAVTDYRGKCRQRLQRILEKGSGGISRQNSLFTSANTLQVALRAFRA